MFGPGETDEWGVQKSAAPPNRGEPAAQSCWVLWENGELWRLASRSATAATTLRPPTHLPIYPSICGVHHARLSSVAILARRGHACGRFAARRARNTPRGGSPARIGWAGYALRCLPARCSFWAAASPRLGRGQRGRRRRRRIYTITYNRKKS